MLHRPVCGRTSAEFNETQNVGPRPTGNKIIEIKEVKFRPNTDINDYDVKRCAMYKFLGERRRRSCVE
jgi:translation initiation factor IF-3